MDINKHLLTSVSVVPGVFVRLESGQYVEILEEGIGITFQEDAYIELEQKLGFDSGDVMVESQDLVLFSSE